MPVLLTAAERPDLWDRGIVRDPPVWPEYNLHGDVLNQWWSHLDEELADFQFVLYDEASDTVLAEGQTGTLWWDGTDSTLPDGIDRALEEIFRCRRSGVQVNTLCALAAVTPKGSRAQGLSRLILEGMRTIGTRHGLTHLVAPVRPSWKHRYPTIDIARYAAWRRPDGLLLDPWMRVHERLGARTAGTVRRSLQITGSVAEWESWTAMAFPESGDYVFPEGLAMVHVDREADVASYWEPNVWMVHPVLTR